MRSYAQLSQEETSSAWIRSSLRIYYLTAIVCCGGVLFGYDSGVIGIPRPDYGDTKYNTR